MNKIKKENSAKWSLIRDLGFKTVFGYGLSHEIQSDNLMFMFQFFIISMLLLFFIR